MKNIANGLTWLFFSFFLLSESAEIYSEVADGGQSGNAGLKFRLTQNGLNYLNNILLYEMNEIIPRLHLDDVHHAGERSSISVTNQRITDYKPPDRQTLTLTPPDLIIWKASGVNVVINGHVDGSFGRFSESGDFDAKANNVDLTIGIHPTRQNNGQFGVQARNCHASVSDLSFNIYNSGRIGRMLDRFQGPVIRRMRPRIEQRLCAQATKLIDNAANDQLGSIPTKIPLNQTGDHMFGKITGVSTGSGSMFDTPSVSDNGDKSIEMRRELTKNISKHLVLDYSNLREPSVQSQYIETYNFGEISYHGGGGTPFSPPVTHEPTNPPYDRMAYVLVSDYTVNSMLYNAYKHDLLKILINGDATPQFKNYLKTNCDNSDSLFDLCLGTIVPEMQDTFPNSQGEIALQTVDQSPAVLFRGDGTIDVMGKALMTLFAVKSGKRNKAVVAVLDMMAKAKLYLDGNKRVKGNATIQNYTINMKENYLKGFNQDKLNQFRSASKILMEQSVNAHLQNGIRMPSMKAIKFRNSKLNVFDRTIRIDTDFEVDKDTLTKTAARVIQQNGGQIDGV